MKTTVMTNTLVENEGNRKNQKLETRTYRTQYIEQDSTETYKSKGHQYRDKPWKRLNKYVKSEQASLIMNKHVEKSKLI